MFINERKKNYDFPECSLELVVFQISKNIIGGEACIGHIKMRTYVQNIKIGKTKIGIM